jgi:hypothetical protein
MCSISPLLPVRPNTVQSGRKYSVPDVEYKCSVHDKLKGRGGTPTLHFSLLGPDECPDVLDLLQNYIRMLSDVVTILTCSAAVYQQLRQHAKHSTEHDIN